MLKSPMTLIPFLNYPSFYEHRLLDFWVLQQYLQEQNEYKRLYSYTLWFSLESLRRNFYKIEQFERHFFQFGFHNMNASIIEKSIKIANIVLNNVSFIIISIQYTTGLVEDVEAWPRNPQDFLSFVLSWWTHFSSPVTSRSKKLLRLCLPSIISHVLSWHPRFFRFSSYGI